MKSAKTLATLWRDSTSASSSAQNKYRTSDITSAKEQNEEMDVRSAAHRQSDFVRCKWASTASCSRKVTIALTIANSSRAS
jgi:hypothetical protein